MAIEELVAGAIPMVSGVILFLELFYLFNVSTQVQLAKDTAMKAIAVVAEPKISDHWKEKILPFYASKLLISTMGILFCMGLLILFFFLAYGVTGIIFFENLEKGLEQLMKFNIQVCLVGIGIVYGVLRKRIGNG